jgi:hypothetical protein
MIPAADSSHAKFGRGFACVGCSWRGDFWRADTAAAAEIGLPFGCIDLIKFLAWRN